MAALDILNELNRRGVEVELAGGKIRLQWPEDALDDFLVESIKTYKDEIITILSVDIQKPLPSACPLVTGKITPGVARRCRFDEKLLKRLAQTGELSSSEGCPLSSACGLWCPWPRKSQPGGSDGTGEVQVKCLGYECVDVSYKYEDGIDRACAPMLWCSRAGSTVIDLTRCPLDNWEKDHRGWARDIKENRGCKSKSQTD